MSDDRNDSLNARPRMRDSPSFKWAIIAFVAALALIFGATFIGVTEQRAATASNMISPWTGPATPGTTVPGPTRTPPAPNR
jgi:hypothetical protein